MAGPPPFTNNSNRIAPSGPFKAAGGGTGDIQGDVGSADNRLVRSDGTTGDTIQGSPVTVDDDGTLHGTKVPTPATGPEPANKTYVDTGLASTLAAAEAYTDAHAGIGGTTGTVDNRVLRADGIGGHTAQSSLMTVDDAGLASGITFTDPSAAQQPATKASSEAAAAAAGAAAVVTSEAYTDTQVATKIGGTTGATDNRVLRADGTGGKTAQSSAMSIDDTGKGSGVTFDDPTAAQQPATKNYVDVATNFMSAALRFMIFGSGVDGALSASSGTTTLTKDTDYSSITLTGTARIDCAGFRLRCSGICDLRGMPEATIFRQINTGGTGNVSGAGGAAATNNRADGQTLPGSALLGSVGGAGGTATGVQAAAGTTQTFSGGGGSGAGGAGGAGSGGAGGASRGGTPVTRGGSSLPLTPLVVQMPVAGVVSSTGSPEAIAAGAAGVGGSGGGGDGTSGAGGGGCGAAGAGLWFSAWQMLCLGAAPGVISARGGQGGLGGSAAAGNRGGGGGGSGGGGGFCLVTVGQLLDAGAANACGAEGGNGGAGGNGTGTGTGGTGGSGGSGGYVCVANLALGTVNTNGGTGGGAGQGPTGNAGGAGGVGEATRVSL